MIEWNRVISKDEIDQATEISHNSLVFIFKHSTSCGTSSMVLNRLENISQPKNSKWYFVDLLSFRDVSNYISEKFEIRHESPQLIVLKDGKCVGHASHISISLAFVNELTQDLQIQD